MGASEIEAFSNVGPLWGPLLVLVAIIVPAIIPLLRREREKPADPMSAIHASIRAMTKDIEDLKSERKSDRRDFEKLERRIDLYLAIKDMGK